MSKHGITQAQFDAVFDVMGIDPAKIDLKKLASTIRLRHRQYAVQVHAARKKADALPMTADEIIARDRRLYRPKGLNAIQDYERNVLIRELQDLLESGKDRGPFWDKVDILSAKYGQIVSGLGSLADDIKVIFHLPTSMRKKVGRISHGSGAYITIFRKLEKGDKKEKTLLRFMG